VTAQTRCGQSHGADVAYEVLGDGPRVVLINMSAISNLGVFC
jgi:hypothetical protein